MDDVVGFDIERGIEIRRAEVLHCPPLDDELARHRSDDQPVRAARRLQRAAEQVVVAHLVDRDRSRQLDVRFVGPEPHILAHRQLQVPDLEAVEEEALELRAEPLRADQRRVDEVLYPRLVQVHDALVDEIGEMQHTRRDRAASGERRAEHRTRQRHAAARRQGEIAAQIERLELGRRDVQREDRLGEPFQAHEPGQLRVPAFTRRGDAVHADRVAPERQAAVHVRIAHVERGDRGRRMADFEAAPEPRRFPRPADTEVGVEDAFDVL